MSAWERLNRGETNIDFVGNRRRWFIFSAVLLLLSIGSLGIRQLNLGVEFVGGLAMQTTNPSGAAVAEIRGAMQVLGLEDATIQLVDGGAGARVTTRELDREIESAAVDALAAVTGAERREISIDSVGPTFGGLVARRALVALGVFLGAAILFITWRLELKMAVAGLIALFHDLLVTIGVYSITGFTVSPATMVAILVILGYSLYDTVVVFDKVGELVELEEEKTYTEIVNQAMNSVLARSLATSLTSLLPVGSILFVGAYIFGAPTLVDFALALFVGIAAGTYSSIFIAPPMLAAWKEQEEEWKERAEWVERRVKAGRR